jgi:PleD family two-component response regulator
MVKPRRTQERAKTDKADKVDASEKTKAKARLLVAEDEASLRDVLRFQLQSVGYEIHEAVDGKEALEKVGALQPDLVLLDVMMPQVDGYDVCRRLRMSFLTRHIPIIMLTAKSTKPDKQTGLEGGANDYVTKPWDAKELQLRIRNVLEWSRQQRSASPLTGLPGNLSINEEIRSRIESETPFAMLQIDVDFFKSFNDRYGYQRGDNAIQTVARILVRAAHEFGADTSFVGHIGGDDFVMITRPDDSENMAEFIVNEFNAAVPGLYDPEDQQRGFVEVRNRAHQMDHFPLMSLTVALVSTDSVAITHLAQLIDIAQELKEHGKGIPGSVVVGERRRPGDARQSVA